MLQIFGDKAKTNKFTVFVKNFVILKNKYNSKFAFIGNALKSKGIV